MVTFRPSAFALLLLTVAASAPPATAQRFKIETEAAGIHRITFEDLALEPAFWSSSALELSHRGRPVALHVEDGGDGRFGPGDHLEFVAERLTGEGRHHHGWSSRNVYWLRQSRTPSPRVETTTATAVPAVLATSTASALRSQAHFEEEKIFLRFPNQSQHSTEVWYWHRLSHLDAEPFQVALPLPHLSTKPARGSTRGSEATVDLEVRLRGWSELAERPRPEEPDHVVDLWLGDRHLIQTRWNNSPDGHRVRIPDLPPSLWQGPEGATLRLVIPQRPRDPAQPESDPLVDVVVLDWVRVDYPVSVAGDPGRRLVPVAASTDTAPGAASSGAPAPVVLHARPQGSLILWDDAGRRVRWPAAAGLHSAAVTGPLYATAGDALRPARIRTPPPPRLRRPDLGADYIVVVHPRLRAAVAPLVEAHRRRGLRVETVGIDRIYDEFGDGIAHPRALRDFLTWAYQRWQRPRPRFVLLVGDASWDTKNDIVRRGNYARAPYAPGRGIILGTERDQVYSDKPFQNRRNLIPTWSYPTLLGHAATDNWFVDVEGDDRRPEMAIGRWPVVDPREVEAIVAKTLRQLAAPSTHRGKRDLLWISDGNPILGVTTDRLVRITGSRGLAAHQIRPEAGDGSPEERRERLLAAFDAQPALVHFFGHGGRSIWRTGMGEEESRRDLFTLDDLDRLAPRDRLPVLLSMSCYSAPFDHPNVDSIGEKFLRLEDRGAAAVFAASARNSPTFKMSWSLILELTRHDTLGEAIVAAKARSHNRDFIEQYNLLGDPALPVPLPRDLIDLSEAVTLRDGRPAVHIAGLESGGGEALVEWLAGDGRVLAQDTVPLRAGGALATFGGDDERPRAVRVYAWDAAAGRDGSSRLELTPGRRLDRVASRKP